MDLDIIFNQLIEIGKIGNKGSQSSQSIHHAAKCSNDFITAHLDSGAIGLQNIFEEFASEFGNNAKWRQDEKLLLSVSALYLLNHALTLLDQAKIKAEKDACMIEMKKHEQKKIPEPSHDLISLQHQQAIEGCVKYIIYSSYFGSLDEDAVMYLKMKLVKELPALAGNLITIPPHTCHGLLRLTLKHLLPLIKHKSMGIFLQRSFLPEILCGLLQLSFSPTVTSLYPEDMNLFRQELDILLNTISPAQNLRAILLIKGAAAQKKGKCWLKRACQSLYTRRFLLKEGGVHLVLEAALSLADLSDWKKKEVMAALISSPRIPNEIIFYEKLCPQILDLLHKEQQNGDIFQVLSFSVCHLAKRSTQLAKVHLFDPLLSPLKNLTEDGKSNSVPEQDLASTVSLLYKLIVQVLPPSLDFHPFLKPVLRPLASIAALPPTCHVKTEAQLLLVRFLCHLETKDSVATLMLLAGLEESEASPALSPGLKLVSSLNRIEIESQSDACDWIEVDERLVKGLVSILNKVGSNPVVLELVRCLSALLDFTVLNEEEPRAHELLTVADVQDRKSGRFRRLSLVVGLLTAITDHETLIESLFSDLTSALPVIDTLLKTSGQHCADNDLAQTREGFLINCIMLLSCYVSERNISRKMSRGDWQATKELVPTLKQLRTWSQNAALSGLVEQLFQLVLTHGASGVNTSERKVMAERPLITETTPNTTTSKTISPAPQPKSLSALSRSPYQEALVDVCSVHLPIRGHALISLNKLVQTKDEEAMANKDRILSLFEHHLRDEDSYIYLAAIEGLVALSTQFPHKVITILTEEFGRDHQSLETRLKLVEILTKTSRCLGPLLPKYKSLFLNCLLNGVRDSNELIRASCLSNLGEVCKDLRFSVEPILHEVLTLVENAVKCDKSLEVKRAAILLITLLLQGLGKDSLRMLQAVILDIYRSLKHLASTHPDPVLVTQAELALEEIDSVTKEFLLPKINLTKKIFITEVPPDFF